MTRLDLIIVIVVLSFAGIGVLRGWLREFASLLAWAVATMAAWFFSASAASWFTWVGDATLRRILGFVVVFAAVFMVVSLAALALRLLFFASVPGVAGRISGGMLGAFRGTLVMVILVLLAGLTSLPQKPWWQDSSLVTYLESAALALRNLLPDKVAHQFRYSMATDRNSTYYMDFSPVKSENTRLRCASIVRKQAPDRTAGSNCCRSG
ncbi:MAG: CvpA family protein [Acidiferrobacterales bacterium]